MTLPAWLLHAHPQSNSRAHLCPARRFPARLLPRGGAGRAAHTSAKPALLTESRRQAVAAAHPASSPHLAVPYAAPTVCTVCVLTRAKFSPYPCDILSFICASTGKFWAHSPPPHHVSAAPAASSHPSHQSLLLSMHCDADFFFHVLLPGEGKRKKAERRRGKIWIKNS